MKIFCARLNYDTTSADLQQLFEQYGEVLKAQVIYGRENGKSKGFGFVEMPNEDEALTAIEELNDATLHERRIVVKEARANDLSLDGRGRHLY